MKKVLTEEINRMRALMSLKPVILSEQVGLIKKIFSTSKDVLDDAMQILKKTTPDDEITNIATRIEQEGAENLSDDTLELILSRLDYDGLIRVLSQSDMIFPNFKGIARKLYDSAAKHESISPELFAKYVEGYENILDNSVSVLDDAPDIKKMLVQRFKDEFSEKFKDRMGGAGRKATTETDSIFQRELDELMRELDRVEDISDVVLDKSVVNMIDNAISSGKLKIGRVNREELIRDVQATLKNKFSRELGEGLDAVINKMTIAQQNKVINECFRELKKILPEKEYKKLWGWVNKDLEDSSKPNKRLKKMWSAYKYGVVIATIINLFSVDLSGNLVSKIMSTVNAIINGILWPYSIIEKIKLGISGSAESKSTNPGDSGKSTSPTESPF